jgi:hypothetical protein
METIMAKGFGLRDYAAGKISPGRPFSRPTAKPAEWPDETILRDPRNDPETDAP